MFFNKEVIIIRTSPFSNRSHLKERLLIERIHKIVAIWNTDNISRTEAYLKFYQRHPEIRWSFLAHMVSRNAGWNMCDLEGKWFPKVVKKQKRESFFHTYEKANWLIFHDAFPQLLLYHYSTKKKAPMFHLLKHFHVSSFMEKEWLYFWHKKDMNRLMIALIINEQNVIQKPVIDHPILKERVFKSPLFQLQDWFHFTSVLFPTMDGRLYGASVSGFRSVDKRIDLGKRLATILFHKDLYQLFYQFAINTIHTGSRYDYEQYIFPERGRETPFLRMVYPVVHHSTHCYEDWSRKRKIKKKWLSPHVQNRQPTQLTSWYKKKEEQLRFVILLNGFFNKLFYKKRE